MRGRGGRGVFFIVGWSHALRNEWYLLLFFIRLFFGYYFANSATPPPEFIVMVQLISHGSSKPCSAKSVELWHVGCSARSVVCSTRSALHPVEPYRHVGCSARAVGCSTMSVWAVAPGVWAAAPGQPSILWSMNFRYASSGQAEG